MEIYPVYYDYDFNKKQLPKMSCVGFNFMLTIILPNYYTLTVNTFCDHMQLRSYQQIDVYNKSRGNISVTLSRNYLCLTMSLMHAKIHSPKARIKVSLSQATAKLFNRDLNNLTLKFPGSIIYSKMSLQCMIGPFRISLSLKLL